MELKDLSGKHILSGVDRISRKGNWVFDSEDGIMFCLDGKNYQCFEDPDDGYRSYLRDLATTDEQCRYTFPETEVACYWSCDSGEDDVLTMRETVNGKIVLRIGTWDVHDWYPCCVMDYHPENLPCNKGLEDKA